PRLERTPFDVIAKLRHPARQINKCGLHHILGRGVIESRLPRYAVDEPPVSVEKLAPAILVLPVPQAGQKALARREERIGAGFCQHDISSTCISPSIPHSFQQNYEYLTRRAVVAQTSESAVSQVSKPAGRPT